MPKQITMDKKKIDPHHCRCFSIPKLHFRDFEIQLLNLGYTEPIFDADHGQILSLTKRISEYYQIHVKLMRTGRIEAEIEYPQDYPIAHLNSTHSFSAHLQLVSLFNTLQVSHKCKHKPPMTCLQPQIIPANNPTNRDAFLIVGGLGALADIFLNDGKLTKKALNFTVKETKKSIKRKLKRRKYLT